MAAAWTAFWIASAFFLFEFVSRLEPSLATAAIARHYGLNAGGFGTLASLFFWVYAPMQIVVGIVLDRYGARRFVLAGTLACAAGVIGFALAHNVLIGGAARALTGFGASFAFVAALWLVNHWFAPERFALLSGGVNAVGMLGAAVGAVALSGAIERAGWQSVFLVTGAVGLVLFALAWLFLKEPASPATAPAPSVRRDLSEIVQDRRIWCIAIAGLLYYMPVNVYGGLWGSTELMHDHHLTPVAAQTAVSMLFGGMAIGSVAGGWLSDALGHRKYLAIAGTLLMGACFAAVLYLPGGEIVTAALLFVAGLFGGIQMLTFAMAKEGEPNAVAGTVVAFVNMVGIAGALVFQPLVGAIADASGGDYRLALGTVPLCAVLAALALLGVREYRHPEHQPGARGPGVPAADNAAG